MWMLIVTIFACVVVFWPSGKAADVDEYTAWPIFRLYGFAITWFPLLLAGLVIVLWLESKWSDDGGKTG